MTATFEIGKKFEFKRGDRVICNGYPGRVIQMYCEGMVEVRMESGVVCVSANFPDCYPDHEAR